MRVVLIGVSHWHTPFFLNPCLEMPDVIIAGVGDTDLSRAEPAAVKAGCKAYADYREMCAALKPDFAFALARHCDMAKLARFLIDRRIPFAMEKPCAIDAAEAADIAARAAAAVPVAWSKRGTCIRRRTRCSTCTTPSGPKTITSWRATTARGRHGT